MIKFTLALLFVFAFLGYFKLSESNHTRQIQNPPPVIPQVTSAPILSPTATVTPTVATPPTLFPTPTVIQLQIQRPRRSGDDD